MAKVKSKKGAKVKKLNLPVEVVQSLPSNGSSSLPTGVSPETPGIPQGMNERRALGPILIVEPDPLAGHASLIYTIAGQRVLAFAREHPLEVSPEVFTRNVLARVAAKDPTIKLLVALDSSTGDVLGHGLAMIEGMGQDRWIFCYQTQVDVGGTDIVQRMIDLAIPWGKEHGCVYLLMATYLGEEFWQHKYGFEPVRHIMRRAL